MFLEIKKRKKESFCCFRCHNNADVQSQAVCKVTGWLHRSERISKATRWCIIISGFWFVLNGKHYRNFVLFVLIVQEHQNRTYIIMHHAFKTWCIVSTSGRYAKSVTVVDTISTTVIFYLFPFWGCFWKETGDISNISSHKQIVCPNLMRPWSEKTGLGKTWIVIRI